MNISNCVDKDDLVTAVTSIESLRYLLQEIEENYFSLDMSNPEDVITLLYDFDRIRAHINTISELARKIDITFKENNITGYSNHNNDKIAQIIKSINDVKLVMSSRVGT